MGHGTLANILFSNLRLILNVSFSQSQSQTGITLIPVEMFKLSNNFVYSCTDSDVSRHYF